MNSNFTTLAALTGHHAASAPNKPAIRVDGAVWSYGDLHERVLQTVAARRRRQASCACRAAQRRGGEG